ncbi:hypothetical protein [Pseudoxanthomonas indica]|uniref:Lipoprotein n=1 Tax=Pseudoxanthomonas indica TaxID=428993 RepID=A0A1T5LUN9_9GAMM|nr:hypothetical protein [Pseudoxanthomonas indica]GGD39795.1 hypothetical protein GCM10007235_09830 [Pseudoxanthomonas indica]SKC79676.1 hypothetical protein SAMN06296058_3109 [Pseudoxanthomonas indica]
MKSSKIFGLLGLILLMGCVHEEEGEVATNISKSLTSSKGVVKFDISKPYLDARTKHKFQIVALVVARDDLGALSCTIPQSSQEQAKVWVDLSGYKWVKLKDATEISYTRDEEKIAIRVNGLSTSLCETRGKRQVNLGVIFDAKPRPNGWSGEGMHGFNFAIPPLVVEEK